MLCVPVADEKGTEALDGGSGQHSSGQHSSGQHSSGQHSSGWEGEDLGSTLVAGRARIWARGACGRESMQSGPPSEGHLPYDCNDNLHLRSNPTPNPDTSRRPLGPCRSSTQKMDYRLGPLTLTCCVHSVPSSRWLSCRSRRTLPQPYTALPCVSSPPT